MSFIDNSNYLTNATKGSATAIGEPGVYIGIISKIENNQYFLTIPKLSPFTMYGPCKLFSSAPTVGEYVVVTFLDNRFDEPIIISSSTIQTSLNLKTPLTQPIRSISLTTDTPTNIDNGKLLIIDTVSGSVAITINGSLNLSAGQRIDFLWQSGATGVSFSGSGLTGGGLNGTPGLKLRARYSAASLICTAVNTYVLIGDLVA